MTPAEVITFLRQFNERCRDCQFEDKYRVMEAIDAAIEMIKRMENMKAALRQHHKNAMGEGLDPSHPLTKLRVSFYRETALYADTVAALEESK